MNFTKTTLAVALGVILAPVLLMFMACGGCITILGIGATGTAMAPVERRESEAGPTKESTEVTAGTGSGRATPTTPGEASRFTEQFESQNAREIHAADQARHAKESAVREAILDKHRKLQDAKEALAAWRTANPEPEVPAQDTRTWRAISGNYSVEGVLVDVDEVTATIRRSDNGREVEVQIAKLAAESRVYAQDHVETFLNHRNWKATLDQKQAAIDSVELPAVPPEPTPVMTIAHANQQAKKAADAEEAARRAEELNRPKMTMANYNRCRPGMSYDEVVAIVGPPKEVLSETEIVGIHTIMYSWNAGIVANANMTFQDGKLVAKAQFGL